MAKNSSKGAGKKVDNKPGDQPDDLPDPIEELEEISENGALSDGDPWHKPFYLRYRLYTIAGVILSAAWLKGSYDYVESMLGWSNLPSARSLLGIKGSPAIPRRYPGSQPALPRTPVRLLRRSIIRPRKCVALPTRPMHFWKPCRDARRKPESRISSIRRASFPKVCNPLPPI